VHEIYVHRKKNDWSIFLAMTQLRPNCSHVRLTCTSTTTTTTWSVACLYLYHI